MDSQGLLKKLVDRLVAETQEWQIERLGGGCYTLRHQEGGMVVVALTKASQISRASWAVRFCWQGREGEDLRAYLTEVPCSYLLIPTESSLNKVKAQLIEALALYVEQRGQSLSSDPVSPYEIARVLAKQGGLRLERTASSIKIIGSLKNNADIGGSVCCRTGRVSMTLNVDFGQAQNILASLE